MKKLYSSRDPAQATEIKARLETRGIAAVIQQIPAPVPTGDSPAPAAAEGYEILLPRDEDMQQAEAVLLGFFEQSVQPASSEAEIPSPRLNRALLTEVTVVGLVGWLPSIYASIAHYVWPLPSQRYFWKQETTRLVYDLLAVALVLLMVRKNREPLSSVGLFRPRLFRDTLGGAVTWLGDYALWLTISMTLIPFLRLLFPITPRDPSTFFLLPTNAGQLSFRVLTIIASAFYQELLMRGYLLPRLERLLGSPGNAIVATTVFFALGHISQGVYGVIGSACVGLVYGIAFSLTGRLWPVFLAHAAHNLFLLAERMLA